MKLAVTGAAGALGRHLCALLTDRNIPYIPLTRQEWDLRTWADEDRLCDMMCDADTIVHAAAIIPPAINTQALFDVNLRATLNLADWAYKRDMRFVFVSSGSVYANPHATAISETDPVGPGGIGGLYAASKRLAEMALSEYAAEGLQRIVLRPSAVYGDGLAQDALICRLLEEARAGGPLRIHGADNAINFLHFHDLARAILVSAERFVSGTFNIAAKSPVRIGDVAHEIAELFNVDVQEASIDVSEHGFTRFDFDTTQARSAFEFEPVVSLTQGLQMMRDNALLPPVVRSGGDG